MSIFSDVNTPFEVIQKALPLVPPNQLKRKWLSWQRKQRTRMRVEAEMTDVLAAYQRLYGQTDVANTQEG